MPELAVELYGHRIGVIRGDSYRTFDITFEPSAIIDETLETVRSLVTAETPHPSADPALQDEILRFSQNLLAGRAVGTAS